MANAIELPIASTGLSVRCGSDGVWLGFATADGKHALINAAAMAAKVGRIGTALEAWCAERQQQAGARE